MSQTTSIGTFTTEAGATIPDVDIAYTTYGTYTGDNLVLVEHALTGDQDAADWWPGIIGPGLPLDTDRYFIVCTNVLGGFSGTTGPSSPHPDGGYFGSRFPAISIRDQVAAEHAFIQAMGWDHIHAVIGGSMGGARTLEWSIMFPDMLSGALILAISARASAWQVGIQTAQINFITSDPNWQGGDYYGTGHTPDIGLASARKIAHLTYRGELELDERFGVDPQAGENPLGPWRHPDQRFAIQSYLDYQGKKLVQRFDAGTYVALTEALNRHNVGRGRGGLVKALAQSTVPSMVVGIDTDILYPFHQQEHLARNLGNVIGMHRVTSPVGHDGFLLETRQLNAIMRNFLAEIAS